MGDWWQTEIVDPGKQPLLLCSVAFVVTFAVSYLLVPQLGDGTLWWKLAAM